MSDEMMGDNAKTELRHRADRRVELLEQMDELKDQMKDFKEQDKADGYTEKAIAQIVKEKRKGIDFCADQLQLELEVKTYREACGLPTELANAQKLAHDAAAAVEEPQSKKKRSRSRNETLN